MDKKIVDYMVVGDKSGDKLAKKVVQAIALGWQPFGVLAGDAYGLFQAMVKYE